VLSKTLSLKGVMEPFTSTANLDFMTRAGFTDVVPIQKYLCFEGWLAIK
jgi:tRNA (cmo5U34)-methyltransferase